MEISDDTRFYMPEADAFTTAREQRATFKYSAFFERISEDELREELKRAGAFEEHGHEDRLRIATLLTDLAVGDGPYTPAADVERITGLGLSSYDDAIRHSSQHGLLLPVTDAQERDIRSRGAGLGNGPNWESVRDIFESQLERSL